jgi:hypothetical protein
MHLGHFTLLLAPLYLMGAPIAGSSSLICSELPNQLPTQPVKLQALRRQSTAAVTLHLGKKQQTQLLITGRGVNKELLAGGSIAIANADTDIKQTAVAATVLYQCLQNHPRVMLLTALNSTNGAPAYLLPQEVISGDVVQAACAGFIDLAPGFWSKDGAHGVATTLYADAADLIANQIYLTPWRETFINKPEGNAINALALTAATLMSKDKEPVKVRAIFGSPVSKAISDFQNTGRSQPGWSGNKKPIDYLMEVLSIGLAVDKDEIPFSRQMKLPHDISRSVNCYIDLLRNGSSPTIARYLTRDEIALRANHYKDAFSLAIACKKGAKAREFANQDMFDNILSFLVPTNEERKILCCHVSALELIKIFLVEGTKSDIRRITNAKKLLIHLDRHVEKVLGNRLIITDFTTSDERSKKLAALHEYMHYLNKSCTQYELLYRVDSLKAVLPRQLDAYIAGCAQENWSYLKSYMYEHDTYYYSKGLSSFNTPPSAINKTATGSAD